MVTVFLIAAVCGSLGYQVSLLINYFFPPSKKPKKNPFVFAGIFAIFGFFGSLPLVGESGKLIPPTSSEVKKITLLPFGLDNTKSDASSDVYMVIRNGMIQKREEVQRVYVSFLETKSEGSLLRTYFFNGVGRKINFLPEDWTGGAWLQFQKPRRDDFWKYFVIYPEEECYFIPPSGIRWGKIVETHKFIPD